MTKKIEPFTVWNQVKNTNVVVKNLKYVKCPEHPDYVFFAHRGLNGGFTVSEKVSGAKVVEDHDTLRAAIKQALEILREKTPEEMKNALEKSLKKSGRG